MNNYGLIISDIGYYVPQILGVLIIILGVASIVTMFIDRLRRSSACWILFTALNLIAIVYQFRNMYILYRNRYDSYDSSIWNDASTRGTVLIVISLALLFWAVRFDKKPDYITCALTILTSGWYMAGSHYLPEIIHIFENPEYVCRMFFHFFTPMLACGIVLFFRLVYQQGPFEQVGIYQPQSYLPKHLTCPNCKIIAETDSQYCTYCGTKIPQ